MTQEQFIKLLNSAEPLGSEDVNDIKALSEEYPYFQLFHFLLLRNLKKQNSYEYEKQLKNTLLHISDRRKLFQFIKNDPQFYIPVEENHINSIVNKEEPLVEKEKKDVPQAESIYREEKDTLRDSISEVVRTQVEGGFLHISEKSILPENSFELDEAIEILPRTELKEEYEAHLDKVITDENRILQFEDETEPVQIIDISKHVGEELYPVGNEAPELDLEAIAEADELAVEIEINNIVDNPETHSRAEDGSFEEEVSLEDEEDLIIENIANNIDSIHKSVEPNQPTANQSDSNKNIDTDGIHTFTDWFDHIDPKEIKEVQSGDDTDEPAVDLIDKFLKETPRIVAKPVEGEQEDISEGSAEEKDEFFTETLAKIYIKQKNYEKAIHAYEKLCLKFPEKNSYFAAQIKEIKKILNNQQ